MVHNGAYRARSHIRQSPGQIVFVEETHVSRSHAFPFQSDLTRLTHYHVIGPHLAKTETIGALANCARSRRSRSGRTGRRESGRRYPGDASGAPASIRAKLNLFLQGRYQRPSYRQDGPPEPKGRHHNSYFRSTQGKDSLVLEPLPARIVIPPELGKAAVVRHGCSHRHPPGSTLACLLSLSQTRRRLV